MASITPSFLPSENPRVAPVKFPFRHCTDVQTRLTDIDILGHVNNNVYLQFMDLAKLRYFSDISDGEFTIRTIAAVVVKVECEFYEPTFLDDSLQVWTAVVAIGQHSLTLEQRVVSAVSGHTKCIGRTILVGFDPETLKSAPLRPDLVECLTAFEQREF